MPTATKPRKTTAPRTRRSRRRKPTHEDIAVRAYAIFEAEGGGDEVGHWLRAERELTAR